MTNELPQLTEILDRYIPSHEYDVKNLNESETGYMIALLDAPDISINKFVLDNYDDDYKIMVRRCDPYPIIIATRLKLFIKILSNTIGEAILWICIFQNLARSRKTNIYTLEMFCADFPLGPYTNETMNKIWDKQKYNHQNMVDLPQHQIKLLAPLTVLGDNNEPT